MPPIALPPREKLTPRNSDLLADFFGWELARFNHCVNCCEVVSELVTVFKKLICTSPAKGYFVAATEAEKQEALNYLDSVLKEVGDRRRALAETDRWNGRRGCFDYCAGFKDRDERLSWIPEKK